MKTLFAIAAVAVAVAAQPAAAIGPSITNSSNYNALKSNVFVGNALNANVVISNALTADGGASAAFTIESIEMPDGTLASH
jgi:hypothetical protein